MKPKPFKAWLVWDAAGIYRPDIHHTRRDAKEEVARARFVMDARWKITRVIVRPTSTKGASK